MLRLSGSGTLQILIGTASYVGARADPVDLRQRGAGRLHDRHPADHLRVAAVVWYQQRGGDDGGAEPWRRTSRIARRRQCGRRRSTTCCSSAPSAWCSSCSRGRSSRLFTPDPAVAAYAVRCLRIVSLWLPVLRVRDGADAVVQRRGRHVDADAGSTCSCSGCSSCPWRGCCRTPEGSRPPVCSSRSRWLLDARRGQRGVVQEGKVEDRARVGPWPPQRAETHAAGMTARVRRRGGRRRSLRPRVSRAAAGTDGVRTRLLCETPAALVGSRRTAAQVSARQQAVGVLAAGPLEQCRLGSPDTGP